MSVHSEKEIISATCTSWRHRARARAAYSWQRHWAGLSLLKSATPFLDRCSDPSTVYRCLAHWLAPLLAFLPASLRGFLATELTWDFHLFSPSRYVCLPSPHFTFATSPSPFRRTCTHLLAASRETACVPFCAKQAVCSATGRLTRSRVQPLILLSLCSASTCCGCRSFPFTPLLRFSYVSGLCLYHGLCLSSIRLVRAHKPPTYTYICWFYHEMVINIQKKKSYCFSRIMKN